MWQVCHTSYGHIAPLRVDAQPHGDVNGFMKLSGCTLSHMPQRLIDCEFTRHSHQRCRRVSFHSSWCRRGDNIAKSHCLFAWDLPLALTRKDEEMPGDLTVLQFR
jgi:hypothetical protein